MLVQLSNPEHIICLQGISEDRQNFLYKDSDGTTELKEFPIRKMTYTMVLSLDEEHEGKNSQVFRFPNVSVGPRGRKRQNWREVKEMLKTSHEKVTGELTNCRYPKIKFDQNLRRRAESTECGRHMYDEGHVLEFQRKNRSIEVGARGEQTGIIIENFQALYKHEISVEIGEKVQVNKKQNKI